MKIQLCLGKGLLCLIFISSILIAQRHYDYGPDYSPVHVGRRAFAGIGIVGGSFNSGDAITINPARIAQGNQSMFSISYTPELSSAYPSFHNQNWQLNASKSLRDNQAVAVGLNRNTFGAIEGIYNGNRHDFLTGYRFANKKGLSFGLSLNLIFERYNNLVFPAFPLNDTTRYTSSDFGLSLNLGIHKQSRFAEKSGGYYEFGWGASLTGIGGAFKTRFNPERRSTLYGTTYPMPFLGAGLSLKRRIITKGKGFVDFQIAWEGRKQLYFQFYDNNPLGDTARSIIGRMIASLSDNPNGFGGELAEIEHAVAFRIATGIEKFYASFSTGYMSGFYLRKFTPFNVFGFEMGYSNVYIAASFTPFQNLTSSFSEPKTEVSPAYTLSWRVPINQ